MKNKSIADQVLTVPPESMHQNVKPKRPNNKQTSKFEARAP